MKNMLCGAAGGAFARKPIASIDTGRRSGIYVDVLAGEILTVRAQLSPDTKVIAYDTKNGNSDLGRIISSGGDIIITNNTRVNISAWRGRDINPGPGGGYLKGMYNMEVKDDYQKIGVKENGVHTVTIELTLSR